MSLSPPQDDCEVLMPKRLCLTCFNTAVDIQAFVDSGINFQKTTIGQLFPDAKVEETFNNPINTPVVAAAENPVPENLVPGSMTRFSDQDTLTDDPTEKQSQGILNSCCRENESDLYSQNTINFQGHSKLWPGREDIHSQNHNTEMYSLSQKVYNTDVCVSEGEHGISLTESDNGISVTESEQGISLPENDNGITVTENDQCTFPTESEKSISLTENDQGITVTDNQQCITESERSIILTEDYQGISVAATEDNNSPPESLVKNSQQNRNNAALPLPLHPADKMPLETVETECSLGEKNPKEDVLDKQDNFTTNSVTDFVANEPRYENTSTCTSDTNNSRTCDSQKLPVLASLKILEPRNRSKKCPTCKKTFSRQSHLKSHLASHSSARPFECPVCSMRFKYRRNLVEHSGIHHSCPSFICSMCGLTFKQKSK